jgi:hypothetical protein
MVAPPHHTVNKVYDIHPRPILAARDYESRTLGLDCNELGAPSWPAPAERGLQSKGRGYRAGITLPSAGFVAPRSRAGDTWLRAGRTLEAPLLSLASACQLGRPRRWTAPALESNRVSHPSRPVSPSWGCV